MNKYFVNIIYKNLAKAIDSGYKAGVRSIIKQNKKKFTVDPTFIFALTKDARITFDDKKSKIYNIDYTGKDLDAIYNFKLNAFKVAGVGSWELEEELKKLGVNILESEIPDFDSFELQVRQKMLEYGIGLGDQPPSGWLKQNIDTAIKNSIAGARWNRVNDPELSGLYTHWIYKTQEDERVREEHVALDGRVFRIDDPAAAKILPPIDWGCRCYEEYITGTEARSYETTSPEKSQELLNEVPDDFKYNPGSGKDIWKRWLEEKFHDMPESEYSKLKDLIQNARIK